MPEERYTLAEARILLAVERCRTFGHEFTELKDGMGDIISMHCEVCPLVLVPEVSKHG